MDPPSISASPITPNRPKILRPQVLANQKTSEKSANQQPPEESANHQPPEQTANQEPSTAPRSPQICRRFEALNKRSKRQEKYTPIIPQPLSVMTEDEIKKEIEMARKFFWET